MKHNKLIKIVGVSCLLLVGLTSCEDFLTKDHPTETTDENFWKTDERMRKCTRAMQIMV